MSNFESLIEKKSNLFVFSILAAIAIMFVPVILPHIFHGFHIVHIGIHIAGMTLAIFLTLSTTYAYLKLRTKRLATAALAFSMFVGAEICAIIEATWPFSFYINTISMLEISHILIISMLAIFSFGVFRKD